MPQMHLALANCPLLILLKMCLLIFQKMHWPLLSFILSITKVTGVSFRTPKNYMLYKISKLCHYKSDIGNPNSATSDRITFHLCSYSKLVSPSIIYFTKIKPLKSYEKCFLFHLNSSFGFCNIQIYSN